MPHLVRHHRLDRRQRGALEQVVVERDPLGAEQAADVGRDPRRLARGVHLVDLGDRDAVGARERQDRRLDRRVFERLVLVEDRVDEDRPDQRDEHQQDDRRGAAPERPAPRQLAEDAVEQRQEERADQQVEREVLALVAQPGAEALGREPVVVLAEVLRVEGEREAEQRDDRQVEDPVERGLERLLAAEPPREVAQPRREPGREQQQRDRRGRRGSPRAAASSRLRSRRRSARAAPGSCGRDRPRWRRPDRRTGAGCGAAAGAGAWARARRRAIGQRQSEQQGPAHARAKRIGIAISSRPPGRRAVSWEGVGAPASEPYGGRGAPVSTAPPQPAGAELLGEHLDQVADGLDAGLVGGVER